MASFSSSFQAVGECVQGESQALDHERLLSQMLGPQHVLYIFGDLPLAHENDYVESLSYLFECLQGKTLRP